MLYFMGIGAQKAGTTWLYKMLSHHPELGFPHGKELHFWNRDYPTQSVDSYIQRFQSPHLKEGEITPAYGHLPPETIVTIHRLQPQLKLFYILRNPIERAWSSALMALHRAELSADEASDQWFLDHIHSRGSLARGDYEANIRQWLSVFPRTNFLLLYYDAIQRQPASVLNDCCHHLAISPYSEQELTQLNITQRVFPSPAIAIRPAIAISLHQLYDEKICSLAHFLNTNLDHWTKSTTGHS